MTLALEILKIIQDSPASVDLDTIREKFSGHSWHEIDNAIDALANGRLIGVARWSRDASNIEKQLAMINMHMRMSIGC